MKLNHLDLQVSDVQSTVAFFERAFGLELQSSRTSPALAILSDGAGFVLVLQRKKEASSYPPGFHLGFLVDDLATVQRLREQALAASADVGAQVSDVQHNNRGSQVYCSLPDGYLVEVSCRRP